MNEADNGQDIIISRDVHKWFDNFHVLKGINLNVKKGEVVVIFGPSGSGKSTFIRCINRLEEHQKGQIIVDGVELTNDIRNIEAIRSEVGMVFQQFNLFPHLTVLQNIMLAPVIEINTVSGNFSRPFIPCLVGSFSSLISGSYQRRPFIECISPAFGGSKIRITIFLSFLKRTFRLAC